MVSAEEVRARILRTLKAEGTPLNKDSGLSSAVRFKGLFDNIVEKKTFSGMDEEAAKTFAANAMLEIRDKLAVSWSNNNVLANRVINNYRGSMPWNLPEPQEPDEPEEAEETDPQPQGGPSKGQPQPQPQPQPQGQPQGQPQIQKPKAQPQNLPKGQPREGQPREGQPQGRPKEQGEQSGKPQASHTNSVLNQVITLLERCDKPYIYGPAGCGKTQAVMDAAKYLAEEGQPLHDTPIIIPSPRTASALLGFVDAHGRYNPSPFIQGAFLSAVRKDDCGHEKKYDISTEYGLDDGRGWVIVFDEIDRADADALVILNSAIANGILTIPGLNITLRMDPRCRIAATGNTTGNGASAAYTTGNVLDLSTIDRFFMVRADFDKSVEMAVAKNDADLVDFAHDWRAATASAGLNDRTVLSYRGLGVLQKYLDRPAVGINTFDGALVKGAFGKADLLAIWEKFAHKDNRYARMFHEYVVALPEDSL